MVAALGGGGNAVSSLLPEVEAEVKRLRNNPLARGLLGDSPKLLAAPLGQGLRRCFVASRGTHFLLPSPLYVRRGDVASPAAAEAALGAASRGCSRWQRGNGGTVQG